MQNKQPLPFGAHYSASSFCTLTYHDVLDFNLPLTAANVADSRFGDRFDYIHKMVIGTSTPNGYVLGTIAPHVAGMTYSLSGTDAAKFNISAVGQITLADNTGLSAGTLSFNVVNNVYGTIPVTVPVVNGSGSYLFYDSMNGDDTNAGTQPHAPKKTLPTGTPTVATIYLKRGSTFRKTGTLTPNDGKIYQGYGDPSVARPIIEELSVANINMLADSVNDVYLYDIQLKGGYRAFSSTTSTRTYIKRCRAFDYGSASNGNSQGFYLKGAGFAILKHNETSNGYGDGIYMVAAQKFDVAYNRLLAPLAGVGDCLQITDENNYLKRCTNGHIHHNIGDYNVFSASVKGSMVFQGSSQSTYEHNIAWGQYFGHGVAGGNVTIRHNVAFYAFITPPNGNEFNMIGAAEPIGGLRIYDNLFMFTQRGFNLSGYAGNGFTEWDRTDIYAKWNMIGFAKEAIKSTERLTCNISDNVFFSNVSNAFTFAGRGNTAATVVDNVTAFTNNGGGVGTFTFASKHRHTKGDTTVVAGMGDGTLNTTWTVIDVWSDTTIRVSGVGAQANLTGQTGTATKVLEYVTINDIATENTFQAEAGTALRVRPTISGTCQDGQTVTASATLPAGHTATYQWRLNGVAISGATSAAYTITAGTSSTAANKFASQYNNLEKPMLSCVITVTNPKSMKSIITAVWSDNSVYKTVAA